MKINPLLCWTIKTKDMEKVINLTKDTFLKKVYDYDNNPDPEFLGDRPAVIDFFATWCGPCKMMAPVLDELAEEYGDGISFYKVDVDKENELASVFAVRSIPTFIFIPMDGRPQRAQGAMGKEDFKKIIDTVLKKK